ILNFIYFLRKRLRRLHKIRPYSLCRLMICTGSSPEPQVDAVGIQMSQSPKLFGYDEGRMVGKHDTARTYSDGLGVFSNVAYKYRGSAAAYMLSIVMFCKPIAFVVIRFSFFCQCQRIVQGLFYGTTLRNKCKF